MNIQDIPEYTDGQYYNLGTDITKAQAGLDYINSFMPVLNMDMWAESLIECLDGCYRVSRIPTCRLSDAVSKGSFTMSDILYFLENFVVSVDSYNSDWLPEAAEL